MCLLYNCGRNQDINLAHVHADLPHKRLPDRSARAWLGLRLVGNRYYLCQRLPMHAH